jgi:hypothetical protein
LAGPRKGAASKINSPVINFFIFKKKDKGYQEITAMKLITIWGLVGSWGWF